MPGKNLNLQARAVIENLLTYFAAEKENSRLLIPLNAINGIYFVSDLQTYHRPSRFPVRILKVMTAQ